MMRVLILLFFSLQLLAQDTIYFKNKDIKGVKVEEIGTTEIKYHSADNLQGPIYIVSKSDVVRIKFPNGKIDSFAVAAPVVSAPKIETQPGISTSKEPAYPVEKIEIFKRKLRYEEKGLSDKKLVSLIIKYPFPETKRIMLIDFNKVRNHKNKHYYGLGLVGAGILMQLVGSAYVPGLFFVGAGVGVTGAIMARVNKNKAAAKKVEIARMYNQWK